MTLVKCGKRIKTSFRGAPGDIVVGKGRVKSLDLRHSYFCSSKGHSSLGGRAYWRSTVVSSKNFLHLLANSLVLSIHVRYRFLGNPVVRWRIGAI